MENPKTGQDQNRQSDRPGQGGQKSGQTPPDRDRENPKSR